MRILLQDGKACHLNVSKPEDLDQLGRSVVGPVAISTHPMFETEVARNLRRTKNSKPNLPILAPALSAHEATHVQLLPLQEHNDFARRTNPYGLLMKRRGAAVPGRVGRKTASLGTRRVDA